MYCAGSVHVAMEQNLLQILKRCKSIQNLKQIHAQVLLHGLQESNHILPKLIALSSSFHALPYAIKIFEMAQSSNLVVYNTTIKCFVDNGFPKDAFLLYSKMRLSEISPNNFTFGFLLKACEALFCLRMCGAAHALIVKFGYGVSVFVQNMMLSVYCGCGRAGLGLARRMFDEMLERDVVSWNSIIGGYMSSGKVAMAISLFELMPERTVVSWNLMITGLSRTGDMDLARSVFERMMMKNDASWNAMITGYVMCGAVGAARLLFDRMEEKSMVSWTALISGYAKIGDLESASELFYRMPVKNVVSWNAMISGYNQNGQFDKAMRVFQQMLLDGELRPDEATLVSVVSSCAQLGSLEHGNWIHSYIKKNDFILTTTLGNALIDMFAKCGDMKSSELVFRQMTRKCIITWTSMVWGLAVNSKCRESLHLFDEMLSEGIKPDDVIFIAVLSACTHGALVEEGRQIFNQMVHEFRIEPRMEHYGCMVDLFARAGRLEEAMQFISSMPIEPNAVIWASLLSSCMSYGVREMSEFVKQKIADAEPLDAACQVLLSNLSARGGRWESVIDARAAMRNRGIEKLPGCSLIQVGGEVHEFLVKDSKHGRRKEIYEVLEGMTKLMRQVENFICRIHHRALD